MSNNFLQGQFINTRDSLISVIIPVFNGERYLAESIESVLIQPYRPMEIIIVDDGSTDNTRTIARQYESVRYLFQPNAGLSAALNSGVTNATGSLYAFLDADDIWTENKLSLQMALFAREPEMDVVFGHHQTFLSPELMRNSKTDISGDSEILPGWFKGTMLIKRKSFWKVGLFDTQWILGDFIDWYKRATEKELRMFMLPDVLLKRRIHGNNESYRERHAQKDYVRIMKASLDRQRRRKKTDENYIAADDNNGEGS